MRKLIHKRMLLLLIILISLFPGYSNSQDIEALKNGVVSIAATTFEGKRKQGTGFIVRLEPDTAFILTASHVVEGARPQDIEVKFYKNRGHIFRVTEIHLEGGEKNGLAILTITGKIPSGLKVLNMNTSIATRAGDPMMVIGFPGFGGPWAVIKGEIVGRKGKLITLSGAIDDGNSGSPLLKGGQVVGIITVASNKFAAAVPSVIAHYFMESWGVKFGAVLRSEAASIPVIYIMQMIREKGFHHPQDLSGYGLAHSYIGTFEHEYEPKTLGGDRVIIDHATGLMWQRSGTANLIKLEIASGYVDELNREGYAGFSDWRLPTIEELASLMEPIGRNQDLFIDPLFDPKIINCWSIDSFQDPKQHRGWMADFYRGMLCYSGVFKEGKYKRNQARAVRTMTTGSQKQSRKTASRPTIQSLRMNPTIAKTKIAFDLDVNKKRDVYVINADGSGLTRLTSGPEEAYHPVWSPNGTRIAFWSESNSRKTICLMKPDGSNRHKLTDSTRKFSWSPDGSQFVTLLHNNQIQVINIDGTYGKLAIHDTPKTSVKAPAWSPAGDLIAYNSVHDRHTEISVVSPSGRGPTQLTEAKLNHWSDIPPSWSPDGNKIAFSCRDRKGVVELYLINPDGTGKVKLTSFEPAYGGYSEINEFSWSPDKQKIAFVMEHFLHGYGSTDVFSINIDGTHLVQLTDTPADEESISWSPDAKLIAFASNRLDNWEIYIMNDDGTNLVRLTDTPSNERNPAWKPKM